MSISSHRFFLCPSFTGNNGVQELPPPPWNTDIIAELRYTYDVLELALPTVEAKSLDFYFTKEAYFLPAYGRNVVSVLILEERCKTPAYSRYIRATIRNVQSRPALSFRPHRRMGRLEALLAFEYARDWYLHLRSNTAMREGKNDWPEPVRVEPCTISLPLGYHSQDELPQVAMAERKIDLFFAGNVKHELSKRSYQYWLSTSKFMTRDQLWRVLTKLKDSGPWNIDLSSSPMSQFKGGPENPYSQKMMNSRICVSPRGSVAETYRSYEGLRAGCLVVGNPVPRDTLLADAPILVVDHWKELGTILKKYARNLDFLEEARAKSLAYWSDHLTPARQSVLLAAKLNLAGKTMLR